MSTEVVVTDKNNTVIIDRSQAQVAREVVQSNIVLAGMIGPMGPSALSAFTDVNATNLQNGSLLVYNTATTKWTATTTLEQQIIEAGQY